MPQVCARRARGVREGVVCIDFLAKYPHRSHGPGKAYDARVAVAARSHPRSALHRALGWYIDGGPETIGISAAVVLRGRLTSLSLWCAAWRVGVCWWDREWCDCEFLSFFYDTSLVPSRETPMETPYFVLTTTNAYRKNPISTS